MLDSKILTFLKVIETNSYTAAAEVLHMTQPAVTQHIRKLEEHYGKRLLEFSGRTMRLTDAGRIFCDYAHLQFANEKQLMARLSGLQPPLRVGATLSAADYYLPDAVSRCFLQEPRDVSVTVENTGRLLERMVHGELDCAFIEGNFDRGLFDVWEFCQAKFLPVASALHPEAGRITELSLLHRYPLILREKGSGTRDILEGYLQQQNDSTSSFHKSIEVSSFLMMKRLLKESEAVSFMYEAVAAEEVARGELCFLQLRDYALVHPIHFVCLKNGMQREAAEAFYGIVMAEQKPGGRT